VTWIYAMLTRVPVCAREIAAAEMPVREPARVTHVSPIRALAPVWEIAVRQTRVWVHAEMINAQPIPVKASAVEIPVRLIPAKVHVFPISADQTPVLETVWVINALQTLSSETVWPINVAWIQASVTVWETSAISASAASVWECLRGVISGVVSSSSLRWDSLWASK